MARVIFIDQSDTVRECLRLSLLGSEYGELLCAAEVPEEYRSEDVLIAPQALLDNRFGEREVEENAKLIPTLRRTEVSAAAGHASPYLPIPFLVSDVRELLTRVLEGVTGIPSDGSAVDSLPNRMREDDPDVTMVVDRYAQDSSLERRGSLAATTTSLSDAVPSAHLEDLISAQELLSDQGEAVEVEDLRSNTHHGFSDSESHASHDIGTEEGDLDLEIQVMPTSELGSRIAADLPDLDPAIQATIERIVQEAVWEIVPPLAERLLKKELERLLE